MNRAVDTNMWCIIVECVLKVSHNYFQDVNIQNTACITCEKVCLKKMGIVKLCKMFIFCYNKIYI